MDNIIINEERMQEVIDKLEKDIADLQTKMNQVNEICEDIKDSNANGTLKKEMDTFCDNAIKYNQLCISYYETQKRIMNKIVKDFKVTDEDLAKKLEVEEQ